MNYAQKAREIRDAVKTLRKLKIYDPEFPLVNELLTRDKRKQCDFMRMVNSQMALYDKADLSAITEEINKKYEGVWRILAGF